MAGTAAMPGSPCPVGELSRCILGCRPAPALPRPAINQPAARDLPTPLEHHTSTTLPFSRHGLARMEYYILNDIELSFKDVLKKSLSGEPLADKKALEEWEKKRTEKDMTKKSPDLNGDTAEKKEQETNGKAKNGKKSRNKSGKSDISAAESAEENGDAESEKAESEGTAPAKSAEEIKADKEELAKAKAKAVERSSIVAPQLNLAQMEAAIAKGGGLGYDQEMINDLMAQTYAASVRWPKDSVLHVRLQHIVTCLETKEWPVPANFLMSEVAADSGPATPEPAQNNRDTSTPLSEVTKHLNAHYITSCAYSSKTHFNFSTDERIVSIRRWQCFDPWQWDGQ